MFAGTQHQFHVEVDSYQFIRLYKIPAELPDSILSSLFPIFWNKEQVLNFSFPDPDDLANFYAFTSYEPGYVSEILKKMSDLPSGAFA